jgi:enoyl-CoA hydratase/carnithine racemase
MEYQRLARGLGRRDGARIEMTIHTEMAGGVQRIEMRRADKRNALTEAMYAALADAFEAAARDDAARVVLLLGAPNAFSAGNDIADFVARPPKDDSAPVFRFLRALIQFDKPVVAGVAGMAVGIGTTMLLHCDYVVAGDNAEFSLPFVNIGLCPEAASSLLLPLAIGYKRAAQMLLFAERVKAAQALEWGLVNAVVPADQVDAEAEKRAHSLAAKPPAALLATRRLLRRTLAPAALEALALEAREFGRLLDSPAAKECLTAFLQKRPPDSSKW